ncbi:MAG: NAD(P)H-binding protein [Planctomycetota bacterium]|nr:NAD(P)H-binding protein [Planctomycetota bacterium]
MKIAILGAAGKIGGLTVAEGVAQGHHVRALARNPDRIPDVRGPGSLTRLPGDVLNAASLEQALAGADAVVCTFGAPLNWSTITRMPTVCAVGTRSVLQAMARTGVARLVCMTAIGVGDSRGRGRRIFRSFIRPVLLGRIFADRQIQEDLVRSSATRWSIVRPAELTDAPAGPWRTVDASDRSGPEPAHVPRATVAKFLIREAVEAGFLGRAPILTAAPQPNHRSDP